MVQVYRIDNGIMSAISRRQAGVFERRGTPACCYDCGKSVGNKPKIAWYGDKFLVFCAGCFQENPTRKGVIHDGVD